MKIKITEEQANKVKDLKKEVFLGGTCNNSEWREALMPMLTKVDYFNPVVKNWDESCQKKEIEKRETCDYCLYVLTPLMTGFYSVAEVVQDSNIRPEKTLFCVLDKDGDKEFDKHQMKSVDMTKKMIKGNGANVFNSLEEIADYLNK